MQQQHVRVNLKFEFCVMLRTIHQSIVFQKAQLLFSFNTNQGLFDDLTIHWGREKVSHTPPTMNTHHIRDTQLVQRPSLIPLKIHHSTERNISKRLLKERSTLKARKNLLKG